MGGTTTAPWSIPYPTGSDRVMDGDNAMQAMAERITVLMESPVKPAYSVMTMANGWQPNVLVVKVSGWVHVHVSAAKASWAGGEIMTTLPAGLRPNYTLSISGWGFNAGKPVGITMEYAGALKTVLANTAYGDSGGIAASFSYPAYL